MFQVAPDHMYSLRGKTVKSFGFDTLGDTTYHFNSLGYRSNREFDERSESICVFGNTNAFGLGVPFESTYAELISKDTGIPAYNFSWGCYNYTNLDQLDLIDQVLDVHKPRFVIFQMNNLDRVRRNKTTVTRQNSMGEIKRDHETFMTRIQKTFADVDHCILYWDDKDYDLPMPKFLIHNRYFGKRLQRNGFFDSKGKEVIIANHKSHKLVALKIQEHIRINTSICEH